METGIFANLSNHRLDMWQAEQLATVRSMGFSSIRELANGMPLVDPRATPEEVAQMAEEILREVQAMGASGAYVAGEFSLTYALVRSLEKVGVKCFTATTERISKEIVMPDGCIRVEKVFSFVAWRRYF